MKKYIFPFLMLSLVSCGSIKENTITYYNQFDAKTPITFVGESKAILGKSILERVKEDYPIYKDKEGIKVLELKKDENLLKVYDKEFYLFKKLLNQKFYIADDGNILELAFPDDLSKAFLFINGVYRDKLKVARDNSTTMYYNNGAIIRIIFKKGFTPIYVAKGISGALKPCQVIKFSINNERGNLISIDNFKTAKLKSINLTRSNEGKFVLENKEKGISIKIEDNKLVLKIENATFVGKVEK